MSSPPSNWEKVSQYTMMLSTEHLLLGGPDNTMLNHAVKWLFENVLAVNCIFYVRWT